MNNTLGWLSRLVTARPYVTIAVLLAITVLLGAGATRRAPPTEGADVAFLPPGHAVAEAVSDIDELFGDSGDFRVATLLFRGEALTPGGLSQMDALVDDVVADPAVRGLLAPANAVVAPSSLVAAALQVDDFESVTQAQIDSVRNVPEIWGALAAMTGADEDGTPVAIANIRLTDTGDDRIVAAERRINELAAADEGPLRVSSLSPAIFEDEYKQATEQGMAPLIGLALLLIAVLLLLFTRAVSDMLLALAGLFMAIVWIVGAEGWLGPNALGVIGPPSSLSTMVPVIIISLTVDYAIQAVSHYREQRVQGRPVTAAVRLGLQHVTVPLTLAAVTTIVSLLVTLFSPIGVIGDFGVVAGLGVGMSLVVMLTLLPAGRTIIDRRREARGNLKPARPISNALPGIPRVAEKLGHWVTRRPAPYIVAVVLVTIALGYAATGLESEFSIKDVLPRGGGVLEDMNTIEAAVGGSTEVASLLVRAEVTESRTLLNLHDLTAAFENDRRRPPAAAGPIQGSYRDLIHDWTNDSGEPGDKYDPELEALFREASPGVELDPALMQELVDRLVAREPGLARFLVNDPDGVDTMLLQFPAYLDDPGQTRMLQEEIEERWLGDDRAVTATSGNIVAVAVADQITEGQTAAISTTIAVALDHSHHLLLGDAAPARAGYRRRGAHRLRTHLRAGHHGAAGHSLHADHLDNHGAVHRHRGGLHHPRDPSLPGGVRPAAQPRAGGDPDPRDHRLGAVGLRADDGVRVRGADSLAPGRVAAVRHHRDHHHRLLPGGLRPGGAARDGGLGRLPEHEAALDRAPLGRRVGGARRGDRGRVPAPRGGGRVVERGFSPSLS